MERTREYIDLMEARLVELDCEIRKLEEFADKAIQAVEADYREQIKDLFLRKTEVKGKISKIHEAGGDAWEDMKAGNELSWKAFNDTVKNKLSHNISKH